MIYTSSYKNWKSDKYDVYSISADGGKKEYYFGDKYPELAPTEELLNAYYNNMELLAEAENKKFFVKEYYDQVLANLDPQEVYDKLDHSTLLCYENNDEFCHRHIVAAWLELTLGVEVPEAKANKYKVDVISKPEYIKDYLADVMELDKPKKLVK